MAYDKNYYIDRKQDLKEEATKQVNRIIQDIYSFVRQREATLLKLNQITKQEQESILQERKKESPKEEKK